MALRTLFLLPIALLALLVVADRASAQTCTPIDALPYTITQPGTYCLTGNQSISISRGAAITIASDNVVLDLGDYVVENINASTSAAGVVMPADHTNVTVRGGLVRGFDTGIVLGSQSSRLLVVENVRLDKNYRVGIAVHGAFSTVRNNSLSDTGGTTLPNSFVTAIAADGTGLRIMDNEIANLQKTGDGSAIAIYVIASAGVPSDAIIARNRITNPTLQYNTVGVSVNNASTALVVGNNISNINVGVEFFSNAQGKYRDTVLFNVASPFLGGTNGGGNN